MLLHVCDVIKHLNRSEYTFTMHTSKQFLKYFDSRISSFKTNQNGKLRNSKRPIFEKNGVRNVVTILQTQNLTITLIFLDVLEVPTVIMNTPTITNFENCMVGVKRHPLLPPPPPPPPPKDPSLNRVRLHLCVFAYKPLSQPCTLQG